MVPIAEAQRGRNITSDRYVVNQTFDGQAFFKDNNVWVYTPQFAETFGMPSENTESTLSGIEAAAFRIEDQSYQMCGLGGKADNCKHQYRCLTDVYIDEGKHPLPWSSGLQVDVLADYSSLRWLRTPSEKGIAPKPPDHVLPNSAISSGFTLRPFFDPKTNQEANYFQNGNTSLDKDSSFSTVRIFGYKRNAIAALTVISLSYRCVNRSSSKTDVVFRLESREAATNSPLKRFHEFQLPGRFGDRIDEKLRERHARDRQYYQNLLNQTKDR